ncbi:12676_t:CDS:2, partial [Gigaspora rosea]
MAWSKLEKEDRSLLTKEALKNIVFGLSIEEERQTRMNIIKGLIPQNHGTAFYDFIWKAHCEKPSTGNRSKPSSSQESKVKKKAKKYTTHEMLAKEKENFKLWTNA